MTEYEKLRAAAAAMRGTAATARALGGYIESLSETMDSKAIELEAAGGNVGSTDEPGAMQEAIQLAEQALGLNKKAETP